MKKIFLLLALSLLLTMCKSKKTYVDSTGNTVTVTKRPDVQYRDDFKSVPAAQRDRLLKAMKATGKDYSVLIFTKEYKGEKITVTSNGKAIFTGNLISNLKTGIAEKTRIYNTTDTKVYDALTQKEVIIEAAEAQKHKFIYLLKNPADKEQPFMITYSNTLRPL